MLALLSAALGFAGSLVPKIIELLQERDNNAHELKMLEMQAKLDAQRADSNLEMTLATAQATQFTAVQDSYRADVRANSEMGSRKIVALSGSVRPVITYMFFAEYFLIKLAQFFLLLQPELPWQSAATWAQALVALWNEEDVAIFSAVIAFWFGDRSFKPRK